MKYSECLVSLFMCLEIGVTWKNHLVFIEVFSVASRGTAELAARVSSQRGIGVLELYTGPTPFHEKNPEI